MFPAGLEHWEIIALSGICAVTFVSIASTIGCTLAYVVFREPKAAPSVSPAAASVDHSQPVANIKGGAVATFASARG